MSLESIVQVSISVQDSAVSRAGFGKAIIVVICIVDNLCEECTAGFGMETGLEDNAVVGRKGYILTRFYHTIVLGNYVTVR